jgi:chemotaxis protein CheD
MNPASLAGNQTQAALGERKLNIVQGEFQVSNDPRLVLTTLLGSCVAACIRDPEAGIGGMNHFLLPGDEDSHGKQYGVQAMELLVNGLLKKGARRDRLEAKLFGGAHLFSGLTEVGSQNASFAQTFLKDEGIRFVGGSLQGNQGRRLQYWPVSGRARQILLAKSDTAVIAAERARNFSPASDAGALELF